MVMIDPTDRKKLPNLTNRAIKHVLKWTKASNRKVYWYVRSMYNYYEPERAHRKKRYIGLIGLQSKQSENVSIRAAAGQAGTPRD